MSVPECDQLRTPETISQPDPRQEHLKIIESNGQTRTKTIDDNYEEIKKLILHNSVPEDVQVQFETTKNLILYSWHVYRFTTVAELHAFATLEFALREKAEIEGKFLKRVTLMPLIKIALEEGWLKSLTSTESNIFQKVLPQLRNNLAHGGSTLNFPSNSLTVIKTCSDLINKIFQNNSKIK